MREMDKEYVDLAKGIDRIAGETNGPEKHIVQALGYQIKAIGDLDNQLEVLDKSIRDLNITTTSLMKRQIVLIILQTILAVLLAIATIRIS